VSSDCRRFAFYAWFWGWGDHNEVILVLRSTFELQQEPMRIIFVLSSQITSKRFSFVFRRWTKFRVWNNMRAS